MCRQSSQALPTKTDRKGGKGSGRLSRYRHIGKLATYVLANRSTHICKVGETGHVVNVRKLHQQACRKAELTFRLYDLRHTYGSRAAMAGVDLPTLKELMGHETISTTMQYVHPTPEHKRRAVLRLETYNAEERKLATRLRAVGEYNGRRAIASLKKARPKY